MTSAHRFLGIAILATVLSGCAATTRELASSHLWPWGKEDDSTQGLTADLSRPFPAAPAVQAKAPRPEEFDFNHPLIDQQIARFQDDLHTFYARALARSGRYVPVMETILERHGVPKELAYLPLIESGYELNAVSPAGAVGPWQFIPGTAVRYGLRIDRFVDERRDPIKSTEAAAKYLRDLYDMFNDWHLALAAYNTGEGNIGRILGRNKVEDYWSMIGRGFLYNETENYVPKYMAALAIAQDPEAYGFEAPTPDPIVYDWVRVNKPLSLKRVAEMSHTDAKELKQLNPALRQGVVPQSGYIVKLPKGAKPAYQAAVDQVDPELVAWNPRKRPCDSDDGLHCVRRGETIASIAALYGVSARDLMQANRRTPSYRLKIGEALAIPGAVRRETAGEEDVATETSTATATHTVRKGDTVAAIAKRHGVSSQALMKANGLRKTSRLKAGQKLNLPGRSANKVVATAKNNRPKTHTVRAGETPAAIAARYGTSATALMKANKLRSAGSLKVGQKLQLPAGKIAAAEPRAKRVASAQAATKPAARRSTTHTVRKGDTPASIAQRYGVSPQELMRANGLRNVRGLQLGKKLNVPRAAGRRG